MRVSDDIDLGSLEIKAPSGAVSGSCPGQLNIANSPLSLI